MSRVVKRAYILSRLKRLLVTQARDVFASLRVFRHQMKTTRVCVPGRLGVTSRDCTWTTTAHDDRNVVECRLFVDTINCKTGHTRRLDSQSLV